MATANVFQVTVDAELMARAKAILEAKGTTVDQAIAEMLERTVDPTIALRASENEQSDIFGDDPEYDAWFRAEVQKELDDPSPTLSSEEVRLSMADRRTAALARLR